MADTGFRGAEPLVGEIVGLRTFRVDETGLLLPLYSNEAWYDGTNVAVCAPPTGDRSRDRHDPPDDGCECGFYAYSGIEAARTTRQFRYVQAVVSCWGRVVAGTKGVRAQYARIDAVWLDPRAPRWLRSRVAARYPSARIYTDATEMHAQHPVSALSCYEPVGHRGRAVRVAEVVALGAVLAVGALPLGVLHAVPMLWALWLASVVAAGVLTAWLALGAHRLGHLAAAVVVGGVLAWQVAPVLGVTGWLLRVPLLRGLLGAGLAWLLRLRPHHFPVVRAPREKAFCGVRP